MAGETWKSHKITGREAAWNLDHAEQLDQLRDYGYRSDADDVSAWIMAANILDGTTCPGCGCSPCYASDQLDCLLLTSHH